MIKQETASEIWKCYEQIKRGNGILERISKTVESDPDPENDQFGRNSYQLHVPENVGEYKGHSLVGLNPKIAKSIVEAHVAEMESILKILNEKAISEQHNDLVRTEKKKDYSMHFSLKAQDLKEVGKKLENWFGETGSNIIKYNAPFGKDATLHHCISPRKTEEEKGFSTDLLYFLDQSADDIVSWYSTTDNLGLSRIMMLENLKKVNGVALFIGEIKEGVKEEYELAKQMSVDCILIT